MTTTPDTIAYTARATVTGGRRGGHGVTDDGNLDVQLTAAKEMGGPGTGTNPEQLFAVGYGACFQGALMAVAKKQGVDADGCTLEIAVGLGPEGSSYAITADITVTIAGIDDARAQEIVDAAHEVCPYSKAIRGNVPVTLVGKGA